MSDWVRKDGVELGITIWERAQVLFPLGVTFCFKFYNPNLHNTAWQNRIHDEKLEYKMEKTLMFH